jgi:hypothetical protein
MCYWGLYQSLVMRHSLGPGYAGQALASAVRLKDHATRAEQLYIQAAISTNDAIKAGSANSHSVDKKEIEILRQLVEENPNDIQAKIFLAIALRDGLRRNGEPASWHKRNHCHTPGNPSGSTKGLRCQSLLDSRY